MNRYRYRRRYKTWKKNPSQKLILSALIGNEALDLIVSRFFLSNDEELKIILDKYSSEYGTSAASYAKTNFKKWASGEVKISGQTLTRLVESVPRVLTIDDRFDIAKKILSYYKDKEVKKIVYITIDTQSPNTGLDSLSTAIKNFYNSENLFEFPENLTSAISWLADDDITAARAILSKVEEDEAKIVESHAYKQIDYIHSLLENPSVSSFEQNIEFPNGIIRLSTFTPYVKQPLFKRIANFLNGV